MSRHRQPRRRYENDAPFKVGEERIIETDYGVDGRPITFSVKRGRYGWIVWVVNAAGRPLAPVSTGNYDGDNLNEVLRLTKQFVAGIHGHRN